MRLGTICGYRLQLGLWNMTPRDKAGLLYYLIMTFLNLSYNIILN